MTFSFQKVHGFLLGSGTAFRWILSRPTLPNGALACTRRSFSEKQYFPLRIDFGWILDAKLFQKELTIYIKINEQINAFLVKTNSDFWTEFYHKIDPKWEQRAIQNDRKSIWNDTFKKHENRQKFDPKIELKWSKNDTTLGANLLWNESGRGLEFIRNP